EFRQTRFVEDFEELRRYHSPELSIDNRAVLTYGDLTQKIAMNRTFRDELKYRIRALKWSQLTAFKVNIGYIPAHYIAFITPLRFVDVPKIRTVTGFGEKVVMANSSYVYTTSRVRIWVYEKILELLEVRLRCYNELAKEFRGADSGGSNTAGITFPSWYSENISGYWDIAGLPRVIPGTFFSSGTGLTQAQIPAVLSFIPSAKEPELFGWYFSIGESVSSAGTDNSFSIFIDPGKSAGTIYSRNGKTPEEKTLQLDCVIYVNPGINSAIEQEVIDRILGPFVRENTQGIKARIKFDGRGFEIKEYPAGRPNPLIFRGEF
ncbi:MAG: hypothetical protein LBB77_03155, partial [Treponema sp.]|nr:hypothetical protein [Treponema sp.]